MTSPCAIHHVYEDYATKYLTLDMALLWALRLSKQLTSGRIIGYGMKACVCCGQLHRLPAYMNQMRVDRKVLHEYASFSNSESPFSILYSLFSSLHFGFLLSFKTANCLCGDEGSARCT